MDALVKTKTQFTSSILTHFVPHPEAKVSHSLNKKGSNMSENNNTKVNSNDGNIPNLSDIINSLGKKRKVTPSEKIVKIALARDKAYDTFIEVKEAIKTATENKEDTSFLEMQLDMLTKYKDVLGTQIIKLVEETQG